MRPILHRQSEDPARDAELGHTNLRLVRLRLVLALVAAAILPLAIVAPGLRVLLDDTQAAAADVLRDEGGRLASAVAIELEGARRSLELIAGTPGALAADPASNEDMARAVHQLRTASPFVSGVWIVRPKAAIELDPGEQPGSPPALSATDLARAAGQLPGSVRVVGPQRAASVESADGRAISSARGPAALLLPIPGGEEESVVLAAAIGLDRLIQDAVPNPASSDWSVSIGLPGEAPIPVFDRGGIDVTSLPGEVLGRALDPAEGLQTAVESSIPAPGFRGWSVVLHAPFAVSSVPLPPLALLALSCLALFGLIGWMAAQVLRPAAELEASRHRFRELYATEREESLRDHLTGLGNHRAFQEELARQVDQTGRYHVPMAIALLDLDEFKQVNDTMGHAVGDDLLAEVGRVIRSTIRTSDLGFRTGGDEFAIVLPHTDAVGGSDVANRLLRRLLEDRPTGRYRRPISISAGVSAAPEHAADHVQLLSMADAALYRSKRNGRTMVTTFDASLDRPELDEQERATLSSRIARVAATRALRPVYQPIVHLQTGRTIALEGLVRPLPDSGFESPATLFTAAEVSGRVMDLDRACLDVIVGGAREVPEDVFLSVNISPRTFEAPEFSANAFLSILNRHGILPQRVILELTEREAIEDVDRLRRALDGCRRAGVQIAIDDVGAGNAGIRLLSQIQFDVIKIDLSLVQAGAGRDPVGGVLSSLVDLARRWRALIVAEGVETPEQLRMVRAMGIDAAQGYLLGRPGPLEPARTYDLDELTADGPNVWWLAVPPRPVVAAVAS